MNSRHEAHAVARQFQIRDDFLTPTEKCFLPFSGKLISFEPGLRFLTDLLTGNTGFNVHRDGRSLDRCRTQFKLSASIEQPEEKTNRLAETH